jgi:Flp pilus assembly pilin Flp
VGDEGMLVGRYVRREGGASAVEFAFVLPVFLALVFGIIYFGFAFNTKLTVTQAAREAARLGATLPLDDDGTPEGWPELAFDRAAGAALGDSGIGASQRFVCARFVDEDGVGGWATTPGTPSSICTSAEAGVGLAGPFVQVVVGREVPIEYILGRTDVLITSSGVARYEDSREDTTP